MTPELLARTHSGIVRRDQLLAAGFPPRAITAALGSGSLIRLRRSWYGLPETPYPHRVAIELGGRVGGLTAARSYGLWAGESRGIHVSWSPHGNITGSPLRDVDDVIRHWRLLPDDGWHELWRESPRQAVAQVMLGEDAACAVAVVDSALHCGVLTMAHLKQIVDVLPARAGRMLTHVDGRADSGLESIARLWMLGLGFDPLVHPMIAGLEVDLLLGRSLVIELDGEEFHSGQAAFESDRRRDSTLSAGGFIVIRFSYQQVMHDSAACLARVREHIARGDHLRPVSLPVEVSPEFS
ncbi:MAG: type IV toxin-antitoxin system AbiEi family antitoxin domain-containing protein [Pseudolysinimonas sp.]